MYLQAVIVRIWRYTWWERSSELTNALRDRDQTSFQMDFEAVIVILERYIVESIIEQDWIRTYMLLMKDILAAETLFIS
jgi:hypothetical protein